MARAARARFVLGLVALAGCAAAAPQEPPSPAIVHVAASASAAPTAGASAPSDAPPPPSASSTSPANPSLPPIERLAKISCSYVVHGSVGGANALRFRAGGRPFANVDRVDEAHVDLPIGVGVAAIDLVASGVALTGYVDTDKLAFAPTRPFLVREFLVPTRSMRFAWRGGWTGTATISFRLPTQIQSTDPLVVVDRECGDVGLDEAKFDALEGLDSTTVAVAGKSALVVDRVIPIATVAGGAPIAKLRVTSNDTRTVDILAISGAYRRIAWYVDDLLVFGWVRATDLTVTAAMGGLYGVGSGTGWGSSAHARRRVTCPRDLPLAAEIDGERRSVGRIRAGTLIELFEERDAFTSALVRASSAHPAPGAKFLVRTDDLASCVTP